MSIGLEVLPEPAPAACLALREGLLEILGDELQALWVYGAATFPEQAKRLGDLDTHALLRSRPEQWHAAIRSAGMLYDGLATEEDAREMQTRLPEMQTRLPEMQTRLHEIVDVARSRF